MWKLVKCECVFLNIYKAVLSVNPITYAKKHVFFYSCFPIPVFQFFHLNKNRKLKKTSKFSFVPTPISISGL